MLIVLDAGHSFDTSGKTNPDGLKEYEINQAITEFTRSILITYSNVSVVFTHSEKKDVPLQKRTDLANSIKADCFVSIHSNALGNGRDWNDATGIETFIHPSAGTTSRSLAHKVQKNMIAVTGLKDRGVKTANLHVLRETKMPSILVECGFMTNQAEVKLLRSDSYRKACAEAIAKSITEEFKLTKKETLPFPNDVSTNGHYKVQVGAFKKKQQANELAAELKKKGYESYIIFQKDL